MTRFTVSTCGVLAEFAALDSACEMTAMILGVGGVVVAVTVWWSDVRAVVDHLIGLDL